MTNAATTTYRISLPNDYGSEEADAALRAAFPNAEDSELAREAFDDLHARWPGLTLVSNLDFGSIFTATTLPPNDLPSYWIIEAAE